MMSALLILHPAQLALRLITLHEQDVAQPACQSHVRVALLQSDVEIEASPARDMWRLFCHVENCRISEPQRGAEGGGETKHGRILEVGVQADQPAQGGPGDAR